MSDNPPTPNPQQPAQAPVSPAPAPPPTQSPPSPGQSPLPSPPVAPKPNGNGMVRSPAFVWIAAAVLAVLLFFGIGYLISSYTSENTDDAFIAGHIISIAPRISGQGSSVHVLDNELVHSNELLVELDPSDYQST